MHIYWRLHCHITIMSNTLKFPAGIGIYSENTSSTFHALGYPSSSKPSPPPPLFNRTITNPELCSIYLKNQSTTTNPVLCLIYLKNQSTRGRSWEDRGFLKLIKETLHGTKEENILPVTIPILSSFLFTIQNLTLFPFSYSTRNFAQDQGKNTHRNAES